MAKRKNRAGRQKHRMRNRFGWSGMSFFVLFGVSKSLSRFIAVLPVYKNILSDIAQICQVFFFRLISDLKYVFGFLFKSLV